MANYLDISLRQNSKNFIRNSSFSEGIAYARGFVEGAESYVRGHTSATDSLLDEIVAQNFGGLFNMDFGSKYDKIEEKEQIKKNIKLANKLINFCIKHFNDYKPEL